MFSLGPCRAVKGRSRATLRGASGSHAREIIWCEGGPEITAQLLLEHLVALQIVKRYKFQPFYLAEFDHTNKDAPDCAVELTNGRYFVIEIKTRRFLNPDEVVGLETNRKLLQRFGVPYLLWTNKNPKGQPGILNSAISSNVKLLNSGRARGLTHEEAEKLTEFVREGPKILMDALNIPGINFDVIHAALAQSILNTNLNEVFHERTTISKNSSAEQWQYLFGGEPIVATWWESLHNY